MTKTFQALCGAALALIAVSCAQPVNSPATSVPVPEQTIELHYDRSLAECRSLPPDVKALQEKFFRDHQGQSRDVTDDPKSMTVTFNDGTKGKVTQFILPEVGEGTPSNRFDVRFYEVHDLIFVRPEASCVFEVKALDSEGTITHIPSDPGFDFPHASRTPPEFVVEDDYNKVILRDTL